MFWIDRSLPTIGQMREMIRRPSVEVELKPDGALEFRAEQFPIPIDLASLPDFVGQTLVEMEDRRFRWHPGFDPITLARAAVGYAHGLVGGSRAGGGSTLTQQVARAVFLSQDRTLARKAREIALAIKLELVLSKDQILELYLNRIHFGQGLTGIEQAARHYFGVRARDLNRYQAAMLVGMIPRPREWNPVSDVGAAHRRARLVLDTLRNRELLLPAMHDRLVRTWRSRPLTKLRTGDRNVPRVAPGYLRDWLRAEILALHLPPGEPRRLILTLDPLAQVYAQLAAARLVEAGRTLGATEAAILVLGTDGAVRAMVGGVNYQQSQFNRAAQARRQPASAFKPIVYAAALEAGNTPDTLIEDTPIRIDGKPWPRNFDDRYRGRIPLVTALAESRNAATVRLAGKIGQDRIIDVARQHGDQLTALRPAEPAAGCGPRDPDRAVPGLCGPRQWRLRGRAVRPRGGPGPLRPRPLLAPAAAAPAGAEQQDRALAQQHAARGHAPRHGRARRLRPPRRRQDRHQPGQPRCLVRGLHGRARGRDLGRPGRQPADARRHRRLAPGGAMAPSHGQHPQ